MAYTFETNPQKTKQFFYVLAKPSSVAPSNATLLAPVTLNDGSSVYLPKSTSADTVNEIITNFGTGINFTGTTAWTLIGALESFSANTDEEETTNDTAGNKIKFSEKVTVEMTDLSQNYAQLRTSLDRKGVDYLVIDPNVKNGLNKVEFTLIQNIVTSVNWSSADNKETSKITGERSAIDIDKFITKSALA